MAETTRAGDGINPSNKGETTSVSESKPPVEAEQTSTGDGGKEPAKPSPTISNTLSLADAFEKFKKNEGKPDIQFTISIPNVKYWAYGKEVETELKLKGAFTNSGGMKMTFEGEMPGNFIQKDEKDKNTYLYAPPSVKVSTLLAKLVNDQTELEDLTSLFGLELTFRKFVVTFHKVLTQKKIDDELKTIEKGYYFSIAVYADKKPEADKQYDDQYVLDTPGKYTLPFVPKSTDLPGVADQPFCIVGIGKDELGDKVWGHLGLSLRALMHNTYEFTGSDDKEVDSWSMSIPVVGSIVSSSGRLVFGNPFISFSKNLKSAPASYLSNTRRFLKEKDSQKTNLKDFEKKDYILTMGGKARVGLTLQTPGFSKVLVFEYPSSDEEEKPSRTLVPFEDRLSKASDKSKKGLQRYGSVLDPGIVRLGPFTLYKMGLGLEWLERTDPSDKTIKSKKLCLVMKPGMMIGAAPQKGKSHGFIDINDLSITIPVGSEQETIQPGRTPPKLISPVQFDFKGMGMELAGENDSFLLRGAACWDISEKELSAAGEVLFRLGTKDDPKFLMTIMMAFWLNSEDHKWGFYVYGLAVFRVVRAPIDPVITQTYLTGVALGIGVNYILNIPDIDGLKEFPLVKVLLDDSSDVTKSGPKTAAKQMKPYLEEKSKYLWFALGAEISTLETFTGFLLFIAIFGLGASFTWEICLLGILTFANKGESLYKIQLLFKVLVAWYGLKIEVLLTPSSFIFDRRLYLSGSGYLWTFWDGEHSGKTIFVLGGYHPDYKKPDYFPNPTPIKISYERSFGRVEFSLSGQAYFALADKVVMLGIKLRAFASIDIIWEWSLSASLNVDILIFWSPFSLDARSRLEVGITAVVRLLIVSFRINVRIALELNFWKPDDDSDFGGEFIFQVLKWKVKARFGASQKIIRPISWQQFIEGDLGLEESNPNPLMLKVLTTEKLLAPKAAISDIPWITKSTEPATQENDYAMADRLSPKPIFKGTTVIPIKDLNVNNKQLIADKDKTWTSDFGLVPCFYTKEAFQSELNITCSSEYLFDITPEVNTSQLPINVWSPALLDKPDLKNEGIANTLMGAAVQPKTTLLETGHQIGPFTTSDLIRYFQAFSWPLVVMPQMEESANGIEMAAFKRQINSTDTCIRRKHLLDAISKHQPEVNSNVRLNNTAQLAEKVLIAAPVDRPLGY